MKVLGSKAFLLIAATLVFILSFPLSASGQLTEACGPLFPQLSINFQTAYSADEFVKNGTQLVFSNREFCEDGQIESVQLRGKCTTGLTTSASEDIPQYSIWLQILVWSTVFRTYGSIRRTKLELKSNLPCMGELLTFKLETPLRFARGTVVGLFIPRSNAIQLGLVRTSTNKNLEPFAELAEFHEKQENFPRLSISVDTTHQRRGSFPLFAMKVSGCSCSLRGISPPPITVADDPAVTVLPTRASEPSGTAEPRSNSTDRESYDGSKGMVESYSFNTLSTVVFSIVPDRVSEATEPEFTAMAAMIVGISLLVVFLVSLVLAAVIVGVVFSVWWRKHHPREKESVYSVPVGSEGGPNEHGDIYDEVSTCSVLEPCPYEVPVIVETDVDSGCYENISIKRSSKVLANSSLKMNNAGLYESLLVIQRETSLTGSDVGSICETDATTAIESPPWRASGPEPTSTLNVLSNDRKYAPFESDCYYYKLEPPSPSPMKDLQDSKETTLKGNHSKQQKQHEYWTVEPSYYQPTTPRNDQDIYWPPSENEKDIYSQLNADNCREIPHKSLSLCSKIGEGHFGEVHQATWLAESCEIKVAIKMLKKGTNKSEKIKLLQEAAILGQFTHANIVTLHGVVTAEEPIMVVMELLSNGDLNKYLTKQGERRTSSSFAATSDLLLQFCRQIAEGLAYLSDKSFVHRDIAARNILLDTDLNCKISDFGLTKDLCDEDYYVVSKEGSIPVKWTAPEALFYKKYSTASDIWSYGMTMYEIWSLGNKPFADRTIEEVVEVINTGYCHPPPTNCPRPVYTVMVKCWNPDFSKRPSAKNIATDLTDVGNCVLHKKEQKGRDFNGQALDSQVKGNEKVFYDLQTLYLQK